MVWSCILIFTKLYIKITGTQICYYWTAGVVNSVTPKQLRSQRTGQISGETEWWAAGEPEARDACVQFYGYDGVNLADDPCSFQWKVICEVDLSSF